nr:MAG TPA: Terminase small subunit [Caudoviricetes sp.]
MAAKKKSGKSLQKQKQKQKQGTAIKNNGTIHGEPERNKKKIGRPTAYRPEYCQQLIDYFSVDPMEIIKDAEVDGKVKLERLPAKMPWFAGFARKIGVNIDTLHEWKKNYEEFSEAYKIAKELQREFLVEIGLSGKTSASFVIFTMKNVCGWRDERDLKLKKAKEDKELTDAELDEAIFG